MIEASRNKSVGLEVKGLGNLYQTRREVRELSRLSFALDEIRLFCTLFEDIEFDRDTLVQCWIASGCVWGEHRDYIADLCFEEFLGSREIVCSGTCVRFGCAKKTYKVDVSKLMGGVQNTEKKEQYLRLKDIDINGFQVYEQVQYLSLVGNAIAIAIDEHTLNVLENCRDLKALLLLGNDAPNIRTIPDDVLSAFKHLEVLDLSKTQIQEVPYTIEYLVNLRYLDLSYTLIEWLSEEITFLTKLQTLKLIECRLSRLPEGMRKLTCLENLEFDVIKQLSYMPRGMGSLTELKRLSAFVLHKEDGRGIAELENMNHLKGRFCISRLENICCPSEAMKAALSKKKNLRELDLRWSDDSSLSLENTNTYENVLELLCPTFMLEKLEISCYSGLEYPSWISSPSFDKLTEIILFKWEALQSIPLFGQLPSLKHLSLINLPRVKRFGRCFSDRPKASIEFPSLERLEMIGLCELDLWVEIEDGDFAKLTELVVRHCPRLDSLPSALLRLTPLKCLEVIDCNRLASFLDANLSTSLEALTIDDCPQVDKWIQSFEHEEDWRKNIKHVNYVSINDDVNWLEDEFEATLGFL